MEIEQFYELEYDDDWRNSAHSGQIISVGREYENRLWSQPRLWHDLRFYDKQMYDEPLMSVKSQVVDKTLSDKQVCDLYMYSALGCAVCPLLINNCYLLKSEVF